MAGSFDHISSHPAGQELPLEFDFTQNASIPEDSRWQFQQDSPRRTPGVLLPRSSQLPHAEDIRPQIRAAEAHIQTLKNQLERSQFVEQRQYLPTVATSNSRPAHNPSGVWSNQDAVEHRQLINEPDPLLFQLDQGYTFNLAHAVPESDTVHAGNLPYPPDAQEVPTSIAPAIANGTNPSGIDVFPADDTGNYDYDCLDPKEVENFFAEYLGDKSETTDPNENPLLNTLLGSSVHEPSLVETPAASQAKRKRIVTDEQRENHKQLRRSGACLRCRIYKMKCDLDVPCKNCLKVQYTARIFKQPCFKVALNDVYPFRGGNTRTLQVRSVLPKFSWLYDTPEARTIRLAPLLDNLDIKDTPSLAISVRRFIAKPTDHLSEPFEAPDGKTILIDTPPFACSDATSSKLEKALEAYLRNLRPHTAREIEKTTDIDEILKKNLASDEIVRCSMKEARRYAEKHEGIVADALNIQSSTYITYKFPVIVSGDKLGMSTIDNESFALHGKTPIPLALDEQVDTLVIRYCERTLKPVLRGLKAAMFSRKDKRLAWYETFLTVMVLLSTLEWITNEEIGWVEKYSGLNKLGSASYVQRALVEGWQATAKNLIYHFRCVFNGMVPWDQEWDKENQQRAQLDNDALAYIKKMSELTNSRREELSEIYATDINGDIAKPLIWITQLLMDD